MCHIFVLSLRHTCSSFHYIHGNTWWSHILRIHVGYTYGCTGKKTTQTQLNTVTWLHMLPLALTHTFFFKVKCVKMCQSIMVDPRHGWRRRRWQKQHSLPLLTSPNTHTHVHNTQAPRVETVHNDNVSPMCAVICLYWAAIYQSSVYALHDGCHCCVCVCAFRGAVMTAWCAWGCRVGPVSFKRLKIYPPHTAPDQRTHTQACKHTRTSIFPLHAHM